METGTGAGVGAVPRGAGPSMCGASDTAHLCQIGSNYPFTDPYGYRKLPSMDKPRDRVGTRVNLTLPDEVIAILDRMGAVTGAGRATILREFICESAEGFADIATALEMAQAKNVDAFKVLAKTIDKSVSDSQQLSLDMKRTRRRMRRKSK